METCIVSAGTVEMSVQGIQSGYPREAAQSGSSAPELTDEEKRRVEELKRTDREVRAHEQAHLAAGGHYVKGGASFEYETGPDGRRYAVGGEVSIDTTPVRGDPQATIRKMQVVRKAALAPAQPSPQDRSVAAKAGTVEAQARQELAQQRQKASGEEKPRQEASSPRSIDAADGAREPASSPPLLDLVA